MEENKYEDVLKGIVKIIRNAEHSDIGFASICTYIGDHCPELIESAGEKIRKALIDYFEGWQTRATDENAAYYKDIAIKDILAWLEKVKDFDKQLEEAYKNSDEVQYNRGYQDAMDEKAKFVDVILDFPTNFEREVSHFAASILNKEYDYNAAFIKISAKGLLESAKLELEKQDAIKDGNSIDPHFGKPITIAKMVNDFANGDLQPSLLEIDAYRRGISDTLEKQGEQSKEVTYTHEVETGNGNIKALVTEKVQLPKFKVGDWITNSIETVQITGYDIDYGYQVDCKGNLQHRDTDIIEKEYHLWTIQDAKDGDVLAEDSCIFIIRKLGDNSTAAKTYCTLYNDGDFDDGSILYFDIDSTKPATKEQCELLFKKMAENGYAWDAEKKELKEIEINPDDLIEENYQQQADDLIDMVTEESTWSKKDQDFFGLLEGYLEFDYTLSMKEKANTLDWLKSIKERLQ